MRGLQGIERVRRILQEKQKPTEDPKLVCREGRNEEEA
jgi:hypothetical protein